jgi:hypothetical protein
MKKPLLLLISAILVLVSTSSGICAGVKITATVDKTEATLEDVINLTISIEGASGEPKLPAMPDFDMASQGSSSKVQIINGQMSSSVEYNFMLTPKKEGVFTIGPATLEYKGATLSSNTVKLTIQKTAAVEKNGEEVFVTAEVDNASPFLNEQIVYSFKFCRRVRVANARLTEQPTLDGFISESLGKEKEYQKTINGQTYVVTEIKQALFPIKTGTLTIEPSTLRCDVVVRKQRGRGGFSDPFFDDSFFGFSQTAPKILRSAPITITVKPLPAEGRPSDFSNLIGTFTATADVTKRTVEVGESTTLTLTLTGSGNLKSSQGIKLENLEGFKVYDDKPSFEPQLSGEDVGGRLIIKKALVPLKEGSLQIPPVAISYFNPQSGNYEVTRTESYIIQALPPKDKEKLTIVETQQPSLAKQDIKIFGKDILPIHTSVTALTPVRITPLSSLIIILFLLPIIGFGTCFFVKRRAEAYASDISLVRNKYAFKQFTKRLSSLRKPLSQDEASFYRDAAKSIKDFIGDKLNVTGSALTAAEIEQQLTEAHVNGTTIKECTTVIEMLEAGQFASRQYSQEEKIALLTSMKKVAREINKKIK